MASFGRWTLGLTSVVATVALGACSDDGSNRSTDDVGEEGIDESPDGDGPDAGEDGTADGTTDTADGSTDTADGTSEGPTDDSTTDGEDSTTDGNDDGGPKFDLGGIPDGGEDDCSGGDIDPLFANIWIANSGQGTVSKINTETLIEEGRYYTMPGQNGSPSRTSVNLSGDVAVVNRNGGIAKIAATEDGCVDANNDGMITTSSGANDLLPWGQDECVLWHTALPSASRPAAWTSGEPAGQCDWINAKVWTSAPQGGDAWVYKVNGDDGTIEEQVLVPGANGGLGIYGGAVDPDNDFWGVTYSAGPLVHVRFDDMTYETIALPVGSAYGFTVDSQGRSWVGGWSGNLQRYDPESQQWTSVDMQNYTGLSRGMMEDANGELWIAGLSPNGILRVDTDSATFLDWIDSGTLNGVSTPTGTSIDMDGYVWMVDQSASGGGAFVLDPDTYEVQFISGLVSPYTYSDMTGWALGNVANPQG